MTIKVIKNAYYVSEDLTNLGLVDEDTFDDSYSHLLVVDDIWVQTSEGDFGCVEGRWKGESSDGWWEYEDVKDYFEIVN